MLQNLQLLYEVNDKETQVVRQKLETSSWIRQFLEKYIYYKPQYPTLSS